MQTRQFKVHYDSHLFGGEIKLHFLFNANTSNIDALKSRCKYWDVIHPVFADRTSSRPIFEADNLCERVIEEDIFGNMVEISEHGEDNISDDTEKDDLDTASSTSAPSTVLNNKRPLRLGDNDDTEKGDHDTANSTNAPSTILNDKRPLRLGDNVKKKPKLSMPEAFLEAIKVKNETKKDMLNFNRMKWEDDSEEKKIRWKAEDEQRARDRKIELIRAETERAVAKNALIKTLSELGLTPEKVLEKLNDL